MRRRDRGTRDRRARRSQSRGRSTAVWIVLVVAGLLAAPHRRSRSGSTASRSTPGLHRHEQLRSSTTTRSGARSPTRAVDELFDERRRAGRGRGAASERLQGSLRGRRRPDFGRRRTRSSIARSSRPAFQKLFAVVARGVAQDARRGARGRRRIARVDRGRRGHARPQGDHPRGRRPDRDRRAGRGQASRRRRPDRDPPRRTSSTLRRTRFELLKTLAWVLPLLTLVAFGFAVWLAGERRRAVRGIGITLVVVGVLGLLAAKLTQNYVVDSLVASQGRSRGSEQRVEHPHRPDARLVPLDDRRRDPVPGRRVARRPGPTRGVHSRLDRTGASATASGRTSGSRS